MELAAKAVAAGICAALMALLFHLVPGNSTQTALLLSACFALAGAVVSFSRIRLPLPEGLARKRKR